MTLETLQHIRRWHVGHRATHPVDYHLWDLMLMLWMAGCIGWLPVFACGALWMAPLCVLGMSAPDLYTSWRLREHRLRRVRCDWVSAVSLPRGPDVRR